MSQWELILKSPGFTHPSLLNFKRPEDVDVETINELKALTGLLKSKMFTSKKSIHLNPEFGIGIRQYLFEQVIDKQFLKDKITDKVQIYIPEIEIDDVFIKRENLETTPEIHTIRISLYYKVLADRSTDAILLNFN